MNLKDAMLNGPGAQEWHDQKIKANNRQWVLIVIFLTAIYIGHTCILFQRFAPAEKMINDSKQKMLLYKSQRDTLQQAVDSAVYFHEILKSKN